MNERFDRLEQRLDTIDEKVSGLTSSLTACQAVSKERQRRTANWWNFLTALLAAAVTWCLGKLL